MLLFVLAIPLALAPSMQSSATDVTIDNLAASARSQFRGVVSADQEVATPPVDSDARGHVRVAISTEDSTIRVQVTVTHLTGPATGAHLHLGAPGTNGEIVVDLSSAITQHNPHGAKIQATLMGSAVEGSLGTERDPLGALLRALRAGDIYFNVHTEAYPGGEARGQL